MIIYGTRMYGKKNEVRGYGRCPHCGKVGVHRSYDGRKWGHLYFIPLIPDGGPVRVLRECASCSTGSHIPLANIPALLQAVEKALEDAVIALGAQEAEMTINGQKLPVATVLAANLGDAYCLVGDRAVRRLIDDLQSVNADEELLLVHALAAELKGDIRAAAPKFTELGARARQAIPLFHAARFFQEQGRPAEAIPLAERVEALLVADLGVKQLLIDCYLAEKQWPKVASTYENCFLIAPELRSQKPLFKAYEKACKKAGRPPQTSAARS